MPPPAFVIPEGMSPPDGGFGWVVAAAYALNNVIIIPIFQNFGLIFKDLFVDLKMTGTDIAVIINTNHAFGLVLGLFNGPILRRFSYRKVAVLGSLLVFLGVALTSNAKSFVEFFVFYGLIMSAGSNLCMTSFSYAINSYFRKRRSMAMGIAMTITGLGPVFMPHLISLGMRVYGARQTALLLAGLSLHSLAAALLLQPVRWHFVRNVPDEERPQKGAKEGMVQIASRGEQGLEIVAENPDDEEEDEEKDTSARARKGSGATKKGVDGDDGDDGDVRAPMLAQRSSSGLIHRSGAGTAETTEPKLGTSVWASMASVNSEGLGGSSLALNAAVVGEETVKSGNGVAHNGGLPPTGPKDAERAERAGVVRRWLRAVAVFFDLDLLRDPIYVNIMLGMSAAVFAEINFSLLTPFILSDRHFDTQQIATLVSIIAVSDIVFRFLAPFVKRVVKQPVRVMYMVSLIVLILTRSVLIFSYSFESLIGVMLALGVAKGLRTVFWVLVIPEHVPLERLPAASGLQSLANGLVFMALGPLMGVIRDSLGDYNYVIAAVNCLTALTIVMWVTEFVVVAIRRRGEDGRGRSARTPSKEDDVEKAATTNTTTKSRP